MIDNLHFEFGEIRVFENFVVVVMKEGITVKPEYNDDLADIAEKYYKGRKFGYITYRINSYAVNPMVYLKTSEIENLAAFAVVSASGLKASNLEVEKRFLKKPLKHFTSLDEAKNWINEMIENASPKF
ncbi:hypothetical protein [Aequorivita antarctica]|uniref:STAS/SEC14 domain-containing protein n=1 Tax=Aequorivita antarctica TaxID=153266 RepID=A0A5C6Z4I4_9FLAO|nr:hypothetical protein [Aequorivita antarctica]TXD74364.1 hypothetical protein ESU54_03690 [Aequorivita antarctica]SRX73717.1 hypothetical protein AEQU3_01149 [Aequorivita antarctica]